MNQRTRYEDRVTFELTESGFYAYADDPDPMTWPAFDRFCVTAIRRRDLIRQTVIHVRGDE